jgi:transposase InsO family protein
MMENGKQRKRRQLSHEEKWEVFLEVTSQELSQADAARKWGVDDSVIIRVRALAKDAALAAFASVKPGRVLSPEQVELEVALAENDRLSETGTVEDGRPGGGAVHGLLAWEEQAILDLIEQIWIWDATHFTRAKRVAYAIIDVVTRYWIGYLLSTEQTHTQAQLLFARALEDQGLLGPDGLPPERDEEGPILVAWSHNGAEMTAIDTRQFMALMAIAQHHGRPGTPTDQAHVEPFFSHLKGRLAALGRDPRPGRARHRAGADPRRVQHGSPPRLDRLRHPRR